MAKMSDQAPKGRLGTKSTHVTPPKNVRNKKLTLIQHSGKVK